MGTYVSVLIPDSNFHFNLRVREEGDVRCASLTFNFTGLPSHVLSIGFQDASITKGIFHTINSQIEFSSSLLGLGIMLLLGVNSLAISLLDIKPYFHLQLVPHITQYHQVSP